MAVVVTAAGVEVAVVAAAAMVVTVVSSPNIQTQIDMEHPLTILQEATLAPTLCPLAVAVATNA